MKPTIAYIKEKFDQYNTLYFKQTLPPIEVRLSNAKGFLGKITYKKERRGLFGKIYNTDFVLRINTRIDLPEQEIEDTILHEMIHYFIGYNQLRDTSTHGKLFREQMNRINQSGSRHITISHRLTSEEQKQAVGKKKARIVCIAQFSNGKTGIKVVPKQIRLILQFHCEALIHFDITDIRWYYTEDEYFSKYPSSSALRFYLCEDSQELASILSDSRIIQCDGKSVRLAPSKDYFNSSNNLSW